MKVNWFCRSHFKHKSFSYFYQLINFWNKKWFCKREKQRERERERLTLPTSPALFSEGTCCAILGQEPTSEKSEAEEAQKDGEKGKMGDRSRAGCSQQMGGQRRPLSRLSGVWMVDWKAGKLAGECANEHGCSLTFLNQTMFSLLFLLAE